MPNRWWTIAISLFWAFMMGWLVRQDVLPDWLGQSAPDLMAATQSVEGPVSARWSVLREEQRIGWVRTEWHREQGGWVVFRSQLHLTEPPLAAVLRLAGGRGELGCDSSFHIGPQGNLEHFKLDVFLGDRSTTIRVDGRREGDIMHVKFRSSGFVHEDQFYYKPHSLVGSSLTPLDKLPNLRLGQSWQYQVMSPLGSSIQTVQCEVVAEQVITWRDEPVPCHLVEQRYGRILARCWVAHDGTVLRQELPIGLEVLVLEHE